MWLSTKGFKILSEFDGDYLLSSSGHIYSTKSNKFMTFSITGAGYLAFRRLYQGKSKSHYVHRLVAKYFLPIFDSSLDVNHKDGDKYNNHISNLEMVTKSENTQHGYDNNLLHSRDKHYNAKVTEDEARAIKYGFPGLTHRQVGEIFGLTMVGASKIRTNRTWRGL